MEQPFTSAELQALLELEDERQCAEFGGPCFCDGERCENLKEALKPGRNFALYKQLLSYKGIDVAGVIQNHLQKCLDAARTVSPELGT